MSWSRAFLRSSADHALTSSPAAVMASQRPPRCWWPSPRSLGPYGRRDRTSSATSRCSASGRGARAALWRRRARADRVFEEIFVSRTRLRVLGELLPTGVKDLNPPEVGRWKSSPPEGLVVFDCRGVRCHTLGRFPKPGVRALPCPLEASTAHRVSRRTFHAVVTVRTSQPTAAAILLRATATFRPVA